MENIHPIIKKIIAAEPDTYVIFFVYECPYCQRALELLRKSNVKYKGYNINDINGGMTTLLEVLNKNNELVGFNKNHRTKPIIFFNRKFLGGSDELAKHFNKK